MIDQSAGGEGERAVGEQRAHNGYAPKMYEQPKHSKKFVRGLTVVAYMFTVSFAAIMLSVYYIFLWHPRDVGNRHNITSRASTVCPQPASSGQTTKIGASADEFPTSIRGKVVTDSPLADTTATTRTLMYTMLPQGQASTTHPSPPTETRKDEDLPVT